MPASAPHLPQLAQIEAYGNGGFRFAGMSHRGSILCLPSGIWGWRPTHADEIDDAALAPVFGEADRLAFFLLGTGPRLWIMSDHLRRRFAELRITVETMPTGAAVRTYNIVLAEGRPAAAGFLAVD